MTRITRRHALTLAVAAGTPFAVARGSAASYPEKPVRLIVPIAAGGQTDVVARLLQQTIDRKKLLPQPIVVVNNAAAGGATGTRQVKDAEADGYTLAYSTWGC